MKFGRFPRDQLSGAVLAHALKLPDGRIAKGTIVGSAEIERLRDAGIDHAVAARLEPGDVVENAAAAVIGDALVGPFMRVEPAATGRVNLFAAQAGLFMPDRRRVDALNRIDPSITLATLGEGTPVAAGAMIATVKIIPLAVAGIILREAQACASAGPALALHPFVPKRIRLVQTTLASVKESVLDKTARITAERLAASGSHIVGERRVAHDAAALAEILREPSEDDLTIVFGASAVIDAADVVPSAIEMAGGTVEHIGMPVDPGNLLLIGRLDGRPILGAPGCARSPKENGFDWVLARLLADRPVDPAYLTGLGVGGLLTEIASRPQPRQRTNAPPGEKAPKVGIVVLAAGASRRMGPADKLLARFDGVPLVRRSVLAALGSKARRVVVVVGVSNSEVVDALDGLDVEIVSNQQSKEGVSTSVKTGFAHLRSSVDGVLLMVADQPFLASDDLNRMIDAFEPGFAIVAEANGVRGNPAILPVELADAVAELKGDVGARRLLDGPNVRTRTVALDPRALFDVDTPQALAGAGGVIPD